MNNEEYSFVKNLDYYEYCDYLKDKYGDVKHKYPNKKNSRSYEGLFIHHIKEDTISGLSCHDVAKAADKSY